MPRPRQDPPPGDGRARQRLRRRIVRLERENERLRAVADRQARAAEALSGVAHDLAAAIGVDDVLRQISRAAHTTLPADGAYVDTIDGGADAVEVVARSGWGCPPVGTRVPYPGSLTEAIIEKGEPDIIADIHRTERPIARPLGRSCRMCDGVVAPLIAEGEPLGALVVLRRPASPAFTSADIPWIRILSDLGAFSLREARLLEDARRHERQAVEAEERYRSLFMHNLDAVFLLDADGRFTGANPAAERIAGYEIEEFVGRPIDPLVHPDHLHLARDAVRRILGGEAKYTELHIVRKDGDVRHLEVSGVPAMVNDRIDGVFAVARDITERSRAEAERERLLREVERERSRLASLFELAPASMAVLRGPEHIIDRANPQMSRVFGLRPDPIGRSARDVLPELEEQGYIERLDRVYRTGEPYVGREERIFVQRGPGGPVEEICADFVLQPLLNASGEVEGIFVHGVDLTDLVRTREAIERARREAEEASRAKSEFLAVMSHELRTPLTAVLGYADLLEIEVPGPLTDDQRTQIHRIKVSARHLLDVIEEILTFSRMESGREAMRPRRVDVRTVVRDAVDVTRPTAEEKGLRFRVTLPEEPVETVTDPRKVRRILLNLLANAVRFTPRGEVGLTFDVRNGRMVFRVSDTGIGIRAEDLEKIFEPFWQAAEAMTREVGGTGLGLAVARRLARTLGGEITVESEVGKGSTFSVALPLQAPEQSRPS